MHDAAQPSNLRAIELHCVPIAMPPIPELNVDLDAPPERRWDGLSEWRQEGRELLKFYLRDLGGLDAFSSVLTGYRDDFVDPEYVAEMRSVARILDAREEEVLLVNLYYDALKLLLASPMGCTAFAVDTAGPPLHARNLDWTNADGRLAKSTVIVNFHRGEGAPLYRTVGWPGFVGCLSGVAPGRFAITLNAVLSDDPPELAPPISLLLRRVLEKAETFDIAVATLRDTEVASDGLLLVTGTRPGEMAVIERTPTRAVVRGPKDGAIFVANDYRALSSSPSAMTELTATSYGRYGHAERLVRANAPVDAESCLAVLRNGNVKMGITVQHMVFSAAQGTVVVALPA
ncbi:C45 family autoproteolytic acyltransferase/hydrolase [Pendulispora rubella]|uniref:C45 family autoproteolytic acyltransferase/hydrolase n=1 Tax=Pendulispora rubella TaxID=2741070 RepID=A0ABZ2LCF2_9BACT